MRKSLVGFINSKESPKFWESLGVSNSWSTGSLPGLASRKALARGPCWPMLTMARHGGIGGGLEGGGVRGAWLLRPRGLLGVGFGLGSRLARLGLATIFYKHLAMCHDILPHSQVFYHRLQYSTMFYDLQGRPQDFPGIPMNPS